jgi:flavin reductase (DIM6/NTAB) family NADH-FMN oxidoreductase RutF
MKKSMGAKTLLYPTPVLVVGTYDRQGRPNAMTASWGGLCCSTPPCVAVSLRKATYSYWNIVDQKAFTISIPSQDFIKEADYFGLTTGRTEDKFAATKLTPVKAERVNAPYIGEFPLVLECRLVQTHELGLHTQFIGEIVDVRAEEAVLAPGGLTDIEKIKPMLFDPDQQRYFGLGACLGKAFSVGLGLSKP